MKILTGDNIKAVDNYTIINEPISSIDLMERAATAFSEKFLSIFGANYKVIVVAGKGNNGGDGLAVGRILHNKGCNVSFVTLFSQEYLSKENRENLQKAPKGIKIITLQDLEKEVDSDTILIDAILGTGFKGCIKGVVLDAVNLINNLDCKVVALDIPSGLSPDFNTINPICVRSDYTFVLEFPKLSLLMPHTGECAGNICVIPIGLSKEYISNTKSDYYFTTEEDITCCKRDKFSHKGVYGHALLICGSEGMMGASLLSTSAALRSGCGLVTTHIPRDERVIVQTSCPSAIVSCDKQGHFSQLPNDLNKYNSIGIGCGLGTNPDSYEALRQLLFIYKKPIVFDAEALNILAHSPDLQKLIPQYSILTPHPGEMKRFIGEWKTEEEKIKNVKNLSQRLSVFIVLKGAHTAIFSPNGQVCFNSTGNSGMAKGGSGDVLTGLITGLLARGLTPYEAAVKGVFEHGLAGDLAAEEYGVESMNSFDLINYLFIK